MVEFEKLLAPISGEFPAGVDLREQPADLTFQQLEEERTEVPPEEDPTGAGRTPKWEKVAARCEETLSTTSKDLQIAGWLAEALASLHGFEGLHSGLRLVTELTGKFWEQIHPGLGPEGKIVLPVRARPLSWLGNSKDFLRSAARCPIVAAGEGQRALSWEDYKRSDLVDEKRVLKDQSQYQDLLALGFIDGEQWLGRLGALSGAELSETLGHVVRCREVLEELRALTDKQFGSDEAPNLVGLATLLLDIREYLEGRIPSGEESADSLEGAAAGGGPSGGREDALRRLAEAAEYFRRAEPHSPIPYLIDRAIRWARLPLMDVLEDFIHDANSLAKIQDHLGIRAGESEKS